MSSPPETAGWRGRRGEWYFAAQAALIVLVFFGPRRAAWLPGWPAWLVNPGGVAGVVLMVAGLALMIAAGVKHGSRITALPYPRPGARLLRTGPYACVRHPMYSGGIVIALGWTLIVHSWLTALYTLALTLLLDVKARREERWLVAVHADYADYQRQVRKLIPFIY